MDHSSSFVTDLSVVLGVAAVAALVFRWMRQPALLGYLVAGLLIGPYIPIPIFADPGRVQALSEFGVILVMFSVGLEFSIRRLVRVLPRSGITGLVQMSFMLWSGFGVGRLLDWSVVESIFFGSALAISSTMVVAKVFDEEKPDRRLRELVFGVLVVQDVVAVALIAALTAIASGSSVSTEEIAKVVGTLAVVLVAMVVVGMPVVPRIIRAIVRAGSSEVTVVGVCGACFGLAVLAESLGYSVALGAFLAGMLVAESGRAVRIEKMIVPIRDLFAAVFFVSIGMLVDPLIAWEHIDVALAVSALVIVGQLLSVTTAGVFCGNGLRRSVRAGLALGQIGEFSFILAALGMSVGLLPAEGRDLILAGALLSIMINPLLFAGLDRIKLRSEKVAEGAKAATEPEIPIAEEPVPVTTLQGHTIVIGAGRVGKRVVDALAPHHQPLYVIDESDEQIKQLNARGIEGISGTATTLLHAANPAKAAAMLVAIPSNFESGQIIEQGRAANPHMPIIGRAQSEAEAEYLRSYGANEVVITTDTLADALLDSYHETITSLGTGASTQQITPAAEKSSENNDERQS